MYKITHNIKNITNKVNKMYRKEVFDIVNQCEEECVDIFKKLEEIALGERTIEDYKTRAVGETVEVRGIWTFYNNMVQLKESNVKVLGTDDAFNIEGIAEEILITSL